jgi:UDP-N-acetylglucosamine acyltransferase
VSVSIHPTAIIHNQVQLGRDISIGPHSIIGPEVVIGDGVRIANSVVIEKNTHIGSNCRIYTGAVLGTVPQDLKYQGEKTYLEIGENTTIREYVTINLGTAERGHTVIGNGALLMTYTHVAHDCLIGDHVILANAVNIAGHVEIHEYAYIGGMVPIHQFVKIGRHSMVGGGFRVAQDVCPYMRVAGYPLRVVGLNTIGLERHGVARETIQTLKRAYKLLFKSKLNVSQAIQRITDELPRIDEINDILQFIDRSDRGLIR